MALVTSKGAKGQMRCFECRKAFLYKEGTWHRWAHQEVFLCSKCETATRTHAERRAKNLSSNSFASHQL